MIVDLHMPACAPGGVVAHIGEAHPGLAKIFGVQGSHAARARGQESLR